MKLKVKTKKLKHLMLENFMNMSDLSKKSGVCVTTLHFVFNEDKSISVNTAKKINKVFDLGFSDLFYVEKSEK